MSDKRLQEDLVSLTEYAVDAQGRQLKLPPAKVKAALPAVAAIAAKNNDQQIPATGGGIASPLTETDIADRTYHAAYYTSTDGLIQIPAIASMKFTDANSAEVMLEFDSPP
ncbi:MAG: hypothetical protein FLDDKLPJ_00944 [Phycisphaerae bacterium]|nr:hypothetical protein [Phycisphaerae bacterium]